MTIKLLQASSNDITNVISHLLEHTDDHLGRDGRDASVVRHLANTTDDVSNGLAAAAVGGRPNDR